MTGRDHLRGLDADQRAAVDAEERLLAVIAAAGSGKTTVVARRIAHRIERGDADEDHVLAVTFTRQAAGELRRRLRDLGLRGGSTVGTFHAVALGLLRMRWADLGRPAPGLLTAKSAMLRDVIGEARAPIDPTTLAAEIDWMRARRLDRAGYVRAAARDGRRAGVPHEVVVDLAERYARTKHRRGVVDFDDLLDGCIEELRRDRQFADATRWRFRHLVVDEFQDINPLQFAVLEQIRAGRDDLCVVGDPRQAIYGWNGADPTLLDHIDATLPGVRVVRLRTNYRCAGPIVAAAAVVARRAGTLDDTAAHRPEGPAVALVGAADGEEEAAVVARVVRDLRNGGRWRATAVLARTNAQLEPLATALRSAGIPAVTTARQETTDDPARGALLDDARRIHRAEDLRTWSTDLAAGTDGAVTAVHRDLADAVRRYLGTSPSGTGRAFVEWLRLDETGATTADAVELLTFHAAKGREWRSVVVTGAEVGLVPFRGRSDPEELRLLYVACTRATDSLVLTWAEGRDGRTTGRSPAIVDLVGPSSPERLPLHAVAPSRVRRPSAKDDVVLVALRSWRARAASAAGLPEQAIVADAHLRAIAERRPATPDDLAEIEGLGALAIARLGPRLLDVVSDALQV